MKSPKPSVDLSEMCNHLRGYKDHMTCDGSYMYQSDEMEQILERIDHVFKKCVMAKDIEDVSMFLRRRQRLMFLVAKYVLAAQTEVFARDPPGTEAYLLLSQHNN